MKKILILLLLTNIYAFATPYANVKRRMGSKIPYNKGTFLTNFGAGLISPYYATDRSMVIPPIFASLEYGLGHIIGLGAVFAYTSSGASKLSSAGAVKYSESYIISGLRVIAHFYSKDKLDIFAGAGAAYVVGIINEPVFENPNVQVVGSRTNPAEISPIHPSVFLGGRYYFNNHWAMVFELGYNVGFMTAGLTYRFR
ncbi:MAG: hypothetical protein NW207_08445 [Cytophagales bacterium]|nr:hypothetical protein [Cytophagales bacterium]